MSVEYDLVVIGSTYEGIYAALKAVYLKTRVALVEQLPKGHLAASETIFGHTLTHITRLVQQLGQLDLESNYSPQWHQAQTWAKEVGNIIVEQNSLALLAAQGVDIIAGSGEFVRLPELGFVVEQRKLRATAYLIATGSHPTIPEILGLEEVSYLTLADVWKLETLDSLPHQLTIIGETPIAIQLAQILRRFGREVTLLVADKCLFPDEDSDISQLVQAQLEAEGIQIFTQNFISQVKSVKGKKYLQIGNQVRETDELIFVTRHEANTEGLNLEGVEVQKGLYGIIQVNQKLQTSNSRIYACGSLVRGYAFPNLAQYEVDIVLKNVLFCPVFKVDYQPLPFVTFTDPPIARIGMTEFQAQRRYGNEINIVKYPFKTLFKSQVLGETTGFCKLIIRKNGEILGGHIIGAEAGELIMIIAFAIKHKVKLQSLAKLSYPFSTFSEIIQQTAFQWQRQRFTSNTLFRNWLETWLIWKRRSIR